MNNLGALVVIDGPDAAGKTTLANYLLGCDANVGYIHLGYAEGKDLWRMQYFALLKAAIRLSQGKLTVIDRHWPSEQIYSRTYRGGSNMTAEARGWDRVIRRLCGVYVMAVPTPDSAVFRHSKKSVEMFPPGPLIRDVANHYWNLWHGHHFGDHSDYTGTITLSGGMVARDDTIRYDIDQHGFDLVAHRIYDKLLTVRRFQYPHASDYSKPNFLGNLGTAKFLFVGERINPNKSGLWPFIDYGASSAALSNILHELRFDETHGVWTNAYAKDQHIETLLELKPDLKVIAFGGAAGENLEQRGIAHRQVFHPAYAKRFGQTAMLTLQLGDVLNASASS